MTRYAPENPAPYRPSPGSQLSGRTPPPDEPLPRSQSLAGGGRTITGPGPYPTWRFVSPPGVGDAPQHVYTSIQLAPFSIDGPGDRPASYLRSFLAPVLQNFAVTKVGRPVEGGNLLLSGLYTPAPMASPNSVVFPRLI